MKDAGDIFGDTGDTELAQHLPPEVWSCLCSYYARSAGTQLQRSSLTGPRATGELSEATLSCETWNGSGGSCRFPVICYKTGHGFRNIPYSCQIKNQESCKSLVTLFGDEPRLLNCTVPNFTVTNPGGLSKGGSRNFTITVPVGVCKAESSNATVTDPGGLSKGNSALPASHGTQSSIWFGTGIGSLFLLILVLLLVFRKRKAMFCRNGYCRGSAGCWCGSHGAGGDGKIDTERNRPSNLSDAEPGTDQPFGATELKLFPLVKLENKWAYEHQFSPKSGKGKGEDM